MVVDVISHMSRKNQVDITSYVKKNEPQFHHAFFPKSHHGDVLLMASANFPVFSESDLLIHIAFHYDKNRFTYLYDVLKEVGSYDFENIDVFIDTNNNRLISDISKWDFPGISRLEVLLHDELEHPFLLTWAHRKNIESLRNQYDYFMYLEDDIAVSFNSLQKWRDDSIFLDDYGKIRGFIRIEVNSRNEIVSTDYVRPIRCNEIIVINGKRFIKPKNPYQGFWFYSKKQLGEFYSSKCWTNGNCDWEVRERASAGMIWKGEKHPNSHSLIVPVRDLNIPDYVYVKHLPNNYALNKKEKHGSLKINKIIPKNILFRLCLRIKELILRYKNPA